jgi:hypothetical protein
MIAVTLITPAGDGFDMRVFVSHGRRGRQVAELHMETLRDVLDVLESVQLDLLPMVSR